MLLTHDLRAEDAAGGVQRVHSGVDALRCNVTAQNRGGIQMGKGGGRGRVGQVIGGNVDGLHRGDRALAGGGDALLQGTHLGGQRGLVTNGRGHTAQQCGHLGTGLREAEDIIDEQQHVLILHIAEVLCHGQAGQCHAHTGSRGLVHLAVDQCGLVNNAALGHFAVQVVALAGALANAGKHRVTVVLGGDVIDQLLNQNGLADTGAAEQADLTALGVGADQVNHLDTGLKDLGGGLLLLVAGSGTVDGPVGIRGGGGLVIHRLAQQVEHAPQTLVAYGHLDGLAGVHGICAAHQTIGAAHGNAACHIVAGQLSDLHHQLLAVVVDLNGVEQLRQLAILELDVQHRANDLDHLADMFFGHRLQLLLDRFFRSSSPFGGAAAVRRLRGF